MTADMKDLLAKISDVTVLSIGDSMVDVFVYGDADDISREAPIPVLKETRRNTMLGGAGNLVRNLRTVGAKVGFITLCGEDAEADQLKSLCDGDQGLRATVLADKDRPTSIKTRFVSGWQQLLCSNRESTISISKQIETEVLAAAAPLIQAADVVVLSDYGRGMMSESLCQGILAQSAGKTVLVDPRGRDFSKYKGASLMTPNRAEFAAATGESSPEIEPIIKAAKDLLAKAGVDNILVTLGPGGMVWVSNTGESFHLPTKAREVFDVSGAGDTVLAMMAAGLAAGATMPESMSLANAAAGVVVGKRGTAVAHPGEILAALNQSQRHATNYKVIDLDAAAARVAEWRAEGLKVGLTNGTFDLLHPGHLASLNEARAHCDRLVVGVNSDASVKRYKGDDRPIQGQEARAAVLAALENVHGVVAFDEDTADALLTALKPDVYIKGGDYTPDTLPEYPTTQKIGAEVVFVNLVEGQSTTKTVNKIKNLSDKAA